MQALGLVRDLKPVPAWVLPGGADMRIAVVGSGIGGLSAAWLLSRAGRSCCTKPNDYLGGHADTHRIELDGRALDVDTGFIVHNPAHYPLLTRMFDELGVESQQTTMSFGAGRASGLNTTRRPSTPCSASAATSPSPRLGMLRDLARFYRDAPALLEGEARRSATPRRRPLWLGVPRPAPGADGERVVVVAGAAILEFPAGAWSASANQPPDAAGGRPAAMAGGAWRFAPLRRCWPRALEVAQRLSRPGARVVRNAHAAIVRCGWRAANASTRWCWRHSDQALALLDDTSDGARHPGRDPPTSPTRPCCIPMRVCCRGAARHGRHGMRMGADRPRACLHGQLP